MEKEVMVEFIFSVDFNMATLAIRSTEKLNDETIMKVLQKLIDDMQKRKDLN